MGQGWDGDYSICIKSGDRGATASARLAGFTVGIFLLVKVYEQCRSCQTIDPALLYRSRKMPLCIDCQHYSNLTKKRTGGGVFFDLKDFLQWRRAGERRCFYCGCDGGELYERNMLNVRTQKRYEVIGVDRIDNSLPYTLCNIIPCCGPCNSVRGGALTHPEMIVLSSTLKEIWGMRLNKQ